MIFRQRIHLRYLLIPLFVMAFSGQLLQAQPETPSKATNNTVNQSVSWLKTWPSAESKRKDKSFGKVVKAFVLGKKTPPLIRPYAIVAASPDTFWISDQGSNNLYLVQNDIGVVPSYVSKSKHELSSMVGFCAFFGNKFLLTDSYSKKIYCLNPAKKNLEILNDKLVLEQPTGIAYSKLKQEIWVVETSAHRISVLNKDGELIRQIGKRGTGPGEFNFPTHIWIDAKGFVFVVDAMNFRVQIFNEAGIFVSQFGSQGDATGYFARPKGIATDSFGNIYVADGLFHVVQVFDIQGNFLYKFGNQGHGEGEFWMPAGIYIDHNNNIYVADSYNARIQVFKLMHVSP